MVTAVAMATAAATVTVAAMVTAVATVTAVAMATVALGKRRVHGAPEVESAAKLRLKRDRTHRLATRAGSAFPVAVGVRAENGDPALAPLHVRLGVRFDAELGALAPVPVEFGQRAALLPVGFTHDRPVCGDAVGFRQRRATLHRCEHDRGSDKEEKRSEAMFHGDRGERLD